MCTPEGVYYGMFDQTFIANSGNRRPWTYALGLIGELLALGCMMLLPLIYTEKLGGLGLSHLPMILPPRGQPKPPVIPVDGRRTLRVAREWKPSSLVYAYTHIPAKAQVLIDVVDPGSGSYVPGAPAGDSRAGFVVGGMPEVPVPPVEKPRPPENTAKPATKTDVPVRVGGQVLEAKIIRRVIPAYPPLARQARVQGVVRLDGIISRDGTIHQLRVISGHPLLVQAAVDAVRQWVYRPTFLNGEAVEVQAPIDVNFTLSQ